jgi:3-phosphoshikimate 1-carboxyvinyltransferase
MIQLEAPSHSVKAKIKLTGSKSISNRFLILKEVLGKDIHFENLSDSEDTQLLQNAINQIKNKRQATIDVHHAGTDMRFLTALLSITEGEWIITGSDRMKERPIGELVMALSSLGANISYLEKENFPPLLIKGKKLKGGIVHIDSSVSSQFISALILIAPALEQGMKLNLTGKMVSKPYIEMTCALLKSFGVHVTQTENLISITASIIPDLPPVISIESDWSSASYWYSICALSGNMEIELRSLKNESLQADAVLPEIYKNLGVKTSYKKDGIVLNATQPLLKEFTYNFTNCPDIAQTIAVTCFGLGIRAELNGLQTLKVKETDRILALKNELQKLGANVETGSDWLKMEVGNLKSVKSQSIHTYKDHRMAMSFAPLALVLGQLVIEDEMVVTKSYPTFWEDLKSVGFNVNLQP